MRARLVGRFAVGLCFVVPSVAAQTPAKTAVRSVSGTVANPDGTPVDGASVGLVERDSVTRRTVTDSTGRFHLDALPVRALQLRVRRIGFHTQTILVDADSSGRTATVFVRLEPTIVSVDDCLGRCRGAGDSAIPALREPPDTISTLLRGFYMRSKTSHMGRFIDEKRIAELRPAFTSDALRTVPGVTVRPARVGNEVRIRGCAPLVWVDGTRAKGAQVDEVARPSDIAGIEVYESLTGVPAEFTDRSATCGTILLWLKTR